MNLSIDWGTLIVSVPVIAATCFGAIRFIGKAYLKEYFDQRLEAFKAELQKDNEKYKSELEKEKNIYINKLELQASKNKQIFDLYSKDKYPRSIEVRDLVKEFLKAYNSNSSNKSECLRIVDCFRDTLELNRVFISDQLYELSKEIYKISSDSISAKSSYYYLRSQDDYARDERTNQAFMRYDSYSNKIQEIHDNIENLLRNEFEGCA
ncbi:UNVERIFIED_CONTAM: hypothetical protein ABIC26_002603 [Paenibacillus sp. PvR008]